MIYNVNSVLKSGNNWWKCIIFYGGNKKVVYSKCENYFVGERYNCI